MPNKKNYKRKKFLNLSIKRRLQFRMLVKIWIIVLASLLVTGVIFYFYSDINVGTSYRQFHVKADNFLDFLFPVLLTGFFASLILGVVGALFFPHSFAGPLYRVEKELVEIGKGDLKKEIKLRKGDEVTDLADAINVMVSNLRNQIKPISDMSGEIRELIERSDSESPPETLKKIKGVNENLQHALKEFKL